jgi:hypothetical protein
MIGPVPAAPMTEVKRKEKIKKVLMKEHEIVTQFHTTNAG